jgi:hypothetical protein
LGGEGLEVGDWKLEVGGWKAESRGKEVGDGMWEVRRR